MQLKVIYTYVSKQLRIKIEYMITVKCHMMDAWPSVLWVENYKLFVWRDRGNQSLQYHGR